MSTVTLSPTRIRDAREARGLSQVEAAEAVGVTRASIQNAEAGRVSPRAEVLARMAALYGVTIDSLFVHEPDVAPASTALAGETPVPAEMTEAPALDLADSSRVGEAKAGAR